MSKKSAKEIAKETIAKLSSPADVEQLIASTKYEFHKNPLTVRVIFKIAKDPFEMIKRLIDEEPRRSRPATPTTPRVPGQSSNTATEFSLLGYLAKKWQKYTVLLAEPWVGKSSKMIQTINRLDLAAKLINYVLRLLEPDHNARQLVHFRILSREFLEFSNSFTAYQRSSYIKFVARRSLVSGDLIITALLDNDEGRRAIFKGLKSQSTAIDKTQVFILFGRGGVSDTTPEWTVALLNGEAFENLRSLKLARLADPYPYLFGTTCTAVHDDYVRTRANYLIYHYKEIHLVRYFIESEATPQRKTEVAAILSKLPMPEELELAVRSFV